MEAITFEIANNGGAPDWSMSDEAINAWLNLSVDIAKFYGYKKVSYQEKPSNIAIPDVEKWISTWAPADAMIITLHCWYANKACPGPYFIRQIPRLVKEINKRLSEETTEKFIAENIPSPTPSDDLQTPTTFEPYLIRINVIALNVRKGPGTNYEVTATLINDRNVYTITEESDGQGASKWLKLKSGIGWISKDFVSNK